MYACICIWMHVCIDVVVHMRMSHVCMYYVYMHVSFYMTMCMLCSCICWLVVCIFTYKCLIVMHTWIHQLVSFRYINWWASVTRIVQNLCNHFSQKSWSLLHEWSKLHCACIMSGRMRVLCFCLNSNKYTVTFTAIVASELGANLWLETCISLIWKAFISPFTLLERSPFTWIWLNICIYILLERKAFSSTWMQCRKITILLALAHPSPCSIFVLLVVIFDLILLGLWLNHDCGFVISGATVEMYD